MAHPGGRPSKYKPEFCERLLDFMREGWSIQAVAAELGVNQDTIFEWIKKKPEFSESYKKGKMLQHLWWEKAGRAIAIGTKPDGKFDSKRANPTIFVWMTKNLLKWTDRQDIGVDLKSTDGSMTPSTEPQVIVMLPPKDVISE